MKVSTNFGCELQLSTCISEAILHMNTRHRLGLAYNIGRELVFIGKGDLYYLPRKIYNIGNSLITIKRVRDGLVGQLGIDQDVYITIFQSKDQQLVEKLIQNGFTI